MKKFVFGCLFLFSIIFSSGMHAMEKSRIKENKKIPCWCKIYKLFSDGFSFELGEKKDVIRRKGAIGKIVEIVVKNSKDSCEEKVETKLRNMLKFLVPINWARDFGVYVHGHEMKDLVFMGRFVVSERLNCAVSEVGNILKESDGETEDERVRKFIRFTAEMEKAILYAINENNQKVKDALVKVFNEAKDSKRYKELYEKFKFLDNQGELPLKVFCGISSDTRFLEESKRYFFVWCAKNGFVRTFKHLLDNPICDLKAYKSVFRESLNFACENGFLGIVVCLVESIKTPRYYKGLYGFGETPICITDARLLNSRVSYAEDCVHIFYGSNLKDEFGEETKEKFFDDALSIAVRTGHENIVEYLLTSEHTKVKISECKKFKLLKKYNSDELVEHMILATARGPKWDAESLFDVTKKLE